MEFHSIKPTEADVRNVYRLLLGRAPKTDQAVTDWIVGAPTVGILVTRFLESPEFKRKHGHLFEKPRLIDTTKLGQLVEELASRHPQRELYQPVFGIDVDHGGPVQRECAHRCQMILTAFAGLPTNNMTMLDVGCNMGYVAFYLAKHFASVTGLEYDDLLFSFCTELCRVLDEKVIFKQIDFFQNYESLRGQYDICLLFSVIHYLVASKGLDEAKLVLNDIVACFDFTIIELSSSKDYPYMPDDPADMLRGLTNVDITFLGISDKNLRPVYFIKKRSAEEDGQYPIEAVLYFKPLPTSCSRVYFSERSVVKKLSSNYPDNAIKYSREVNLYKMLSESSFVPKLLGTSWSATGGAIRCERKNGVLLNHLYQLSSNTKFATVNSKMVLACQLILALRELARLGLYWNDLSAHNMMISDGALILLDFGESDTVELNDHVAMLSWVMHDLQLERPESYECGVYSAIHDAGGNRKESRKYMFVAPADFFDPNLNWLYQIICALDSIQDLIDVSEQLIDRIEAAATGEITISQHMDSPNSVDGIVTWASIPGNAGVNPLLPSGDEQSGVTSLAGEPLSELTMAALNRGGSGQLVHGTPKVTTVKGYLDVSKARMVESDHSSELLFDRVEQTSRQYAESLLERANRAEIYNAALIEELEKKSKMHADVIAVLGQAEQISRQYAESLLERANRAEVYNAALLEELAQKSKMNSDAVAMLKQAEQTSRQYAESLLERANYAELSSTAITDEFTRVKSALEHLRIQSECTAEKNVAEFERLTVLLEEARAYRTLNWWRKVIVDR